MVDEIDYTEVPYLQEILNFLPINPSDEEDINSYINNITRIQVQVDSEDPGTITSANLVIFRLK